MIKEIKEDDIAECVDVIRRSFYTVAEELGFTIDPGFSDLRDEVPINA